MSSRMGRIIPLLVASFVGVQSGMYVFKPTLDQYYKELKDSNDIKDVKSDAVQTGIQDSKTVNTEQKQESVPANVIETQSKDNIINQKEESK